MEIFIHSAKKQVDFDFAPVCLDLHRFSQRCPNSHIDLFLKTEAWQSDLNE